MTARIDIETWRARFAEVHGDRYEYEPDMNIVSGTHKIRIRCHEHGWFEQSAQHHYLRGHGCRECSYIERGRAQRMTTEQFVMQARATHGDRYDYSKVAYTGESARVTITCPAHGDFEQAAGTHLQGRGCALCGNKAKARGRQKDVSHFIARARVIHGDRYDYGNAAYTHALGKIEITCKEHGAFWQTPANHAYGYGCPRCAGRGLPSHTENDLFEFVQSICPDAQQSVRGIIGRKELDIYVPSLKLAIELNGVYWHSDKVSDRTHVADKLSLCAAQGIRLLVITCAEWKERRAQFERIVRRVLRADADLKLNARQCEVVRITSPAAVTFLDANHPQQPGRAYTHCFGLIDAVCGLVAVMTFDADAYDRNGRGGLALTRYATSANVRGGASKLFKHAQRTLKFDYCISYSMRDWFDGRTYAILGFEQDGSAPPDYRVYHKLTGFRPKSAWRRSNIAAMLARIGRHDLLPYDAATDPRTERDIQDKVFALRVWDAGKVRWVWQA